MLAEERRAKIVEIVEEQKTISVQDLSDLTGASLATVRRDLIALDDAGLINKVHGGATSINGSYITKDLSIAQKVDLNQEAKKKIGQYAASFVSDEDFVFIDSGTTTEHLVEALKPSRAVFVTNSIIIASKLMEKDLDVRLVGGALKTSTAAVVGAETCSSLANYNFTLGFFGTNGVSRVSGFTTPEVEEAAVKKTAFNKCKDAFILCDSSKFGSISAVTFADFDCCCVITEAITQEEWRHFENIIEVE